MVQESLGDENFLRIVLDSVFAELKTIGSRYWWESFGGLFFLRSY
jgi:hypothetical protein